LSQHSPSSALLCMCVMLALDDCACECGCAQPTFSRSSAAHQPHISRAVLATGSQTVSRMHAEDHTRRCTVRYHASGHAAPAVGATSGLQCASAAPRCCAFRAAGARAARASLTCRCLPAVPQVCTSCPAAQSPCSNVRLRTRAMRMHVF
jgi:hypothetical protein